MHTITYRKGGWDQRCQDWSRSHAVDTNTLLGQIGSQRPSEWYDGSLRRCIRNQLGVSTETKVAIESFLGSSSGRQSGMGLVPYSYAVTLVQLIMLSPFFICASTALERYIMLKMFVLKVLSISWRNNFYKTWYANSQGEAESVSYLQKGNRQVKQ